MSEHDADAVVDRLVRAYFDAEPYTDEEWQRERAKSRGLDAVCHSVQRILSALKPGDRLPGGLRVVQGEPSDAMIAVGHNALWDCFADQSGELRDGWERVVYRAMLAASTD